MIQPTPRRNCSNKPWSQTVMDGVWTVSVFMVSGRCMAMSGSQHEGIWNRSGRFLEIIWTRIQLKNFLRGQKKSIFFNPTLLDTVFSQRGFVCACVINQFFSNIAWRCTIFYSVASLILISPMDCWQNSFLFWCKASFCSRKIDIDIQS